MALSAEALPLAAKLSCDSVLIMCAACDSVCVLCVRARACVCVCVCELVILVSVCCMCVCKRLLTISCINGCSSRNGEQPFTHIHTAYTYKALDWGMDT